MKHKKLFVALTSVFSVIVFLTVLLMIWFFGDSYKDFNSFNKEFEIPGLADGACPQGLGTCKANYEVEENGEKVVKTQNYYFVSAYMTDGSPSRIYVTGEETGYTGYVTMKNTDGTDYFGHCGGIAINNSATGAVSSASTAKQYTLWVTSDKQVYVAKPSTAYSDAKKTIAQEIVEKAAGIPLPVKEGETPAAVEKSITFTTSFNANCRASFCFYYDNPDSTSVGSDRLYVGEFYRDGNYETDKKHWLTTPTGYQNTAFMYEYNVSASTDYGLYLLSDTAGTPAPEIKKIFSLPEKIQGAAFTGRTGTGTNSTSHLILSQSYGLANSHLLSFSFEKVMATTNRALYRNATGESFAYEGVMKKAGSSSVPYVDGSSSLYVYYVDKTDNEMLVKDYSIPCMSEGMCVPTDKTPAYEVYVLFESASKKYKTFVRQQLKNVYMFRPK